MIDFLERFWSQADQSGGPDACWPWTGRMVKGYGHPQIAGYRAYAHRTAWELANAEELGERKALHSCDNPPCVNPAHLRAGTQKENVADTMERNREAFTAGLNLPPAGVCRNGHTRTLENTGPRNGCRICWKAARHSYDVKNGRAAA